MVGRTISHYRIVSQLGAGGMGVVYAAEDRRLGRPVALKFVPDDLAKDVQALERLRSEARTASNLIHPSICTIYDIGEYEGRPFIVMELLKGQTLRERLAAGPLKIHQTVDLGIQVADALDCAHRQHVIHRDIKPANLFLMERGQVKVLDFGLAKMLAPSRALDTTTNAPTADLTTAGVTLGTVAYMSPEQVTGEQLDGRTDLFSTGVVLYECVTGRQPFTGKTSGVVLSAILNRAPTPPVVFNADLPGRLQEVINNCLEKDRELRYQDAAGLRADLKRIRRDLESGQSGVLSMTAPHSGPADETGGRRPNSGLSSSRDRAAVRSRRLKVGAASAAVVAIAALLASSAYLRRTLGPAEPAVGAGPASVEDPLELAATSLRAADYRAALGYSEEVLRTEPTHAQAARIRDAARAMIDRFDEAVATTRRLLAAGDTAGAEAALERARKIDPAAPAIAELSAGLLAQVRAPEAARAVRPSPPPRTTPSAASGAPARPAPRERAIESATKPPPPPVPPDAPTASAPPGAASAQTGSPSPSPAPAAAGSRPGVPPTRPAPAPPAGAAPADPTPSGAPAAVAPDPPAAVGRSAAAATSPVPDDEGAIRRVVQSYARAIETKDLALFRSVKPNLSAEEQRRIEDGFRAVSSQQVSLTILGIERRGPQATVRVRRRDTIRADGRLQVVESQQQLSLTRSGAGWVIREIGR